MLSDSVPPAIMICAPPERMRSAAMAMACSPDEQKRLMVMPGTESGRPARRAAMRATFMPDSASGIAQPRITSSISSGAMAGCFSSRRRMTMAARSSGRVLRKVPLGALPTGVRRQSRITASMIYSKSFQFRSGLPVFSIYCMRSCVFGLPHKLRKASRSRSSKYCSETLCWPGSPPPLKTCASFSAMIRS